MPDRPVAKMIRDCWASLEPFAGTSDAFQYKLRVGALRANLQQKAKSELALREPEAKPSPDPHV